MASVVLLAAAATLAASFQAQAQQTQDNAFTWSGTVANGRSIIIKNINGGIKVDHSTTGRVEVTASKQWRRGNPANVRIEAPHIQNGDALLCALWTPESTCDEDGIHSPRNNRTYDNQNDVSVNFVVRVPDGVHVDVTTVNGGLEISGATSEVRANTVNGAITARSTGGPVRAHTVNGAINISMGALGNSDDLEYETVNGSVTLDLPSNLSAQMELSTVNGTVSTDFPISVVGTLSPKKLRGTIGSGLARIRASTVNGSVTLHRSN